MTAGIGYIIKACVLVLLSFVQNTCCRSRMDCIEVLTEGGRESGDMVNLIILSMIHESLLFRFNSFFKFLAQPALKGPK